MVLRMVEYRGRVVDRRCRSRWKLQGSHDSILTGRRTLKSRVVRLDLNDPRDVSNMDHIRREASGDARVSINIYGTRGLLGYEYHY